MANPFIF